MQGAPGQAGGMGWIDQVGLDHGSFSARHSDLGQVAAEARGDSCGPKLSPSLPRGLWMISPIRSLTFLRFI